MHKTAAEPGYVWESGAVGNRRKESSRIKVRRDRTGGQGSAQREGSAKRNEAKVGLSKVDTGKRIGDTQPAAVETVGADCDGDGWETNWDNKRRLALLGWVGIRREKEAVGRELFLFPWPSVALAL